MTHRSDTPPAATRFSPVRATLQAEGAVLAALAALVYAQLGGSWGMFALLILAPDLTMVGYLAGQRAGALIYNLGHSYLGPAALGAAAWAADWQFGSLVALVWIVHIAGDRAIGYGLKYASHFKDTHLNRV